MTRPLREPGLTQLGVEHGCGVRDFAEPAGLRRPRQVHGAVVVRGEDCQGDDRPEADAVVTSVPGETVGVITADCVPVLVGTRDGRAVAAIHAGWRGLAAGVIEAGIDALRHIASSGPDPAPPLVAALGPHIGSCCYEVDAPVTDALSERFAGPLAGALAPSQRDARWLLDLAHLVTADLEHCGLASSDIFVLSDSCTQCDAVRFHSYRRDGPRSGRLVHFITACTEAAERTQRTVRG